MDTANEPSDGSALTVLVAADSGHRLAAVSATIGRLGHRVVVHEEALEGLGRLTARLHPDVAVVIVSEGTERALASIDHIVHEASCPVIAVLGVQDRAFMNEAARRGVFAYLTLGEDDEELQSSFDIVLRRFAEYHNLEGAFGRRAITERAKGILMERHRVDEERAFAMLREEARRSRRKLVDVAEAVLTGHRLLPPTDQ